MKARFIGKDGSLGFKKGKIYHITVTEDKVRNWLWVKTFWGRSCPYESRKAIENNWDVLY